jgi:4-hydroxy-tetrahydrodipicolinate reductase
MNIKIALIGYGKMGKEIDRIASERNFHVVSRIDSEATWNDDQIRKSDVIIHFAYADSVLTHVKRCASLRKNVVVGTTGWQRDLENVKSAVQEAKTGLVYASNFSVGVQMFFRLVRETARLMNKFEEYDVAVHEAHHKDKADSPSGTALTTARILLEGVGRKKTILAGSPDGTIKPEQLQVTSTRAGTIVGAHTVTFDSAADTIELKHAAKTRSGFALGALLAAEWIAGKKGVFTMEDVLADIVR